MTDMARFSNPSVRLSAYIPDMVISSPHIASAIMLCSNEISSSSVLYCLIYFIKSGEMKVCVSISAKFHVWVALSKQFFQYTSGYVLTYPNRGSFILPIS